MIFILKYFKFQLIGKTLILTLFFSFLASLVGNMAIATEDEEGNLKVAYDFAFPPFQYTDSQGEANGFSIELFDEIAKHNDFNVEYLPMTLEKSKDALLDNEIDIILNINYTQDLGDKMNFTESYFNSSAGMLVSGDEDDVNDASDLTDRVVTLQHGTVEYDFLKNIRRINYNVTNNQALSFELLKEGRADAYVGDRYTQEYFLDSSKREKGTLDIESVTSYVAPIEYSMGLRQDDSELLNTLNASLTYLEREGIYNEIYQNWFVDETSTIDRFLRILVILLSAILTGFAIFLGVGYRWNKQLQEEVDKKTKDLINTYQLKNQVLESSPRGVITYDREGMITSFNSRSIEIAGVGGNITGCNVKEIDLFYHMLRQFEANEVNPAKPEHDYEDQNSSGYQGSNTKIWQELTWQNNKNETLTIRYSIYPLYDYQKEILGTILSFEDITEEKKLREEIFEREKSTALNRVVAGICHEIRNPITSIKTFTELLPSKYEDPEFRKELSTYVPSEMERLSSLIEDLFDYAKPKNVEKEVIDLGEIIDSCLVLSKRIINQNGIDLDVDVDSNLKIEADKNQLKQVILNLILNSISAVSDEHDEKFNSQGIVSKTDKKAIFITGERRGSNIIIKVQDTGVGMSEEELKMVFDPFYTTKNYGSGLGLTLSKQYVEENNGKLTIDSQKGVYTCVSLVFPVKEVNNNE